MGLVNWTCAHMPWRYTRRAMRNTVSFGVPERVAMEVPDYRSRTAVDLDRRMRPVDLQEAARELTGTILGTAT